MTDDLQHLETKVDHLTWLVGLLVVLSVVQFAAAFGDLLVNLALVALSFAMVAFVVIFLVALRESL